MEDQSRKKLRLDCWDCGQAGAYFVTICTRDKRHLFWDSKRPVIGADIIRPDPPVLSALGRLVDDALREMPSHYTHVRLDEYVVMPNHIHAIIILEGGGGTAGRIISAPTPSLSTIIGQMKRSVSKQAGSPVWQKSFYDQIIRSEADCLRTWDYIDTNPAKWTEDEYCG